MAPTISHLNKRLEINTSCVTSITLKDTGKYVNIWQNDEFITIVRAPIMKVVRALRERYGNEVMLEVV